jgi:hypothetical protein
LSTFGGAHYSTQFTAVDSTNITANLPTVVAANWSSNKLAIDTANITTDGHAN